MADDDPTRRRRGSSSVLPHNPVMEADFRSATEAMQQAASAMMAATESLRRQFDIDHPPRLPPTYRASHRASDGAAAAAYAAQQNQIKEDQREQRLSVDSGATRGGLSLSRRGRGHSEGGGGRGHGRASSLQIPLSVSVAPAEQLARPDTGKSLPPISISRHSSVTRSPPPPMPPPPPSERPNSTLADLLPQRPDVSPRLGDEERKAPDYGETRFSTVSKTLGTTTAATAGAAEAPTIFGASGSLRRGGSNPYPDFDTIASITPTVDWPAITDSQAELMALDPPAIRTGPGFTDRYAHRSAEDVLETLSTGKESRPGTGHRSTVGSPNLQQHDEMPELPELPRPKTTTTLQSGVFETPLSAPPCGDNHQDDPLPSPLPVVQIGRYTYIRTTSDDDPESKHPHQHHTHQHASHPSSRNSPLDTAAPPLPPSKPPKPPKPPSALRPAIFRTLTHEILFVLLICLAQALMLSGIAQALVPASIIGASFPDTRPGDLAWYTAAYGLTAGTLVLPSGRLGDVFGHRRCFIIGFLWFGLWSLLAGLAEIVEKRGGAGAVDGEVTAGNGGTAFFIFARAMQGAGPALLVPNGQAMLGRTYAPGPRKNLVMCLFGAAAPLGFVCGAAMSSLFAVCASWPWAFYTLAAVCAALAAVSLPILPKMSPQAAKPPVAPPSSSPPNTAQQEKPRGLTILSTRTPSPGTPPPLWSRLDAPGIALGVSGLVLLNFAINQGPLVGWHTPYTYFLLVISLLLLAAFLYAESVASHPLLPLPALKSPTTNFVLACTFAGWGCFSIWVYYAFALIEHLRDWSPLLASAAFAPAPITGLAASLLVAWLVPRVRPQWIMLISMCAFAAGSLLMATSPVSQNYWLNTFWAVLVMPFGMDMSNPAASLILSNSVGREHQGIAASLVVTVVNYSISIALGIAGSVEMGVNGDGSRVLEGYRAAQWFGLGVGGLGVVLAAAFVAQTYARGSGTR